MDFAELTKIGKLGDTMSMQQLLKLAEEATENKDFAQTLLKTLQTTGLPPKSGNEVSSTNTNKEKMKEELSVLNIQSWKNSKKYLKNQKKKAAKRAMRKQKKNINYKKQ